MFDQLYIRNKFVQPIYVRTRAYNKGKTERKIVAAQDQEISTNYFRIKILKEETDSKCQLCKQHEETIHHLTSGCPILATKSI